MPALITGSRRWNVGSDDFVITSVCSSLFVAFWSVLNLSSHSLAHSLRFAGMVAISANMSAFVCHDDALFRAYIYGNLVWSALALVLGVSAESKSLF